MKVLTRGMLAEADSCLGCALSMLEKAERIYRNAHRSWWLHSRTASAIWSVKFVRDEVVKRWRDGYLVPPRTRKVARMERNERKRFTKGGPLRAQGARDRLPADGCPPEGKRTRKVKE